MKRAIAALSSLAVLKADACGNYTVRFSNPKVGRPPISTDGLITIPGFASFTLDQFGNTGPVAICSQRWIEGQSGNFRREPVLMIQAQ